VFSRFGVPYQPAFAVVAPDGEVIDLPGSLDEAELDAAIESALAT